MRKLNTNLGCALTIIVLVCIAALLVRLMPTTDTTPTVYFRPRLASVKSICIASCIADEIVTYGPPDAFLDEIQAQRNPALARALCRIHYETINGFLAVDTLSPFEITSFEDAYLPPFFPLNNKNLPAITSSVSASDRLLLVDPYDINEFGHLFFFMKTDAALLIHSKYAFVIHTEGVRVFWRAVVTSKVVLVDPFGRVLWATNNFKTVSSKVKASKGINLLVFEWSKISSTQISAMFREATVNSTRNLFKEMKTDISHLLQQEIVDPDDVQERKQLFGATITG